MKCAASGYGSYRRDTPRFQTSSIICKLMQVETSRLQLHITRWLIQHWNIRWQRIPLWLQMSLNQQINFLLNFLLRRSNITVQGERRPCFPDPQSGSRSEVVRQRFVLALRINWKCTSFFIFEKYLWLFPAPVWSKWECTVSVGTLMHCNHFWCGLMQILINTEMLSINNFKLIT